ncbi:MAG: hypothetical protein WD334_12030, partial [Chitinophagales bacterium]
MDIISSIGGLFIGFIFGVLFMYFKHKNNKQISFDEFEQSEAEKQNITLEAEKLKERSLLLKEQLDNLQVKREEEQYAYRKSESKVAELETRNENLLEKLVEQKADIENLQERFHKEFELIANRILDEKSTKFTELNKEKLKDVFDPLKERIEDFKKTINETYIRGSKERSELSHEL